jgi:serine/threonine protein kinase
VSAQARLGRYELITRIGQGGMAEVQLALQRGPAGFEKLVVVKLIHGELATQKAFVDMLLDEARVAALVKHPNVVDIYDLGEADGKYFIAMEYLEGEPLLSVLRAGREGKRLDPLSTGRLIADTAEGLDAAHELRNMAGERVELVHHDVSLGNIVVLYNGAVKLVDFGVAKAVETVTGPQTKVQGKFSYMAPEKLKGHSGDRRSDIFSLGCVMWEALTLKRLFRGSNDVETMKMVLGQPITMPSQANPDVPAAFDAIVMRALERDPARRYQTAKVLAVELEELLRVAGYGAKNAHIANYMQETFKDHIDARKKLVQEVVSKGSASAATVDAAFQPQQVIARGSPRSAILGDFTRQMHSLNASMPAAEVPNLSQTELQISPFDGSQFDGTTEIAPPSFIDSELEPPLEAPSSEALHPVTGPPPPSRLATMMDWAEDVAHDPKKRTTASVVAGSIAVVLLIVLIAKCTQSTAPVHPTPARVVAVVDAVVDAAVDAAVDGAVAAVVAAVAPDAAVVPVDAEMATIERVTPPDLVVIDHKPHPASSDAQFQKAFQMFVRGDAKGSLAQLKSAKGANPRYAPTWRLLGQVYKKLGDSAQAKAAFSRYLKLAPNAADAPAIRKEVE